MTLIFKYWRELLVLLVAAAAFWAGWSWQGARYEASIAKEQAAQIETARRSERFNFETRSQAANAQAQKIARLAADSHAARTAADSLRNELASAILSTTPTSAGSEPARDQLLDTMADALTDLARQGAAMAERADLHASDALACVSSWPTTK